MASDEDILTFFASDERRSILEHSERRVYLPGEVLVQQGKSHGSLFRIHSGFARVYREHLGSRVELSRLGPGASFGEIGLLEHGPASATITAEDRVEADIFSEDALEGLFAQSPGLALTFHKALAMLLSRRLRRLTSLLPERLLAEAESEVSLIDEDALPRYLDATEYCDLWHPSISALSAELARQCEGDAERARAAFYWVRDRVTYTLGLTSDRASGTLERRRGSCSHKANLFVALMRSMGIPAGYQFMIVKTREYFGSTNTRRFQQFLSQRSVHVLPAVLLGSCWVRCDVSDDAPLCDGMSHLNPTATKIEFDGQNDAMLHIAPDAIEYYDATCWSSVDELLAKTPRVPQSILGVYNRYLDFFRQFGTSYQTVEAASEGFFEWLGDNHPDELSSFEALERQLGHCKEG